MGRKEEEEEEEEEVKREVEAVESVYGEDCVVINTFPPHLHLHLTPRTADISSQQFVEAIISIQATTKYPKELPRVDLIESKGLDEERQKKLITSIQHKATQLSSSSMLVSLCEEAVERLSAMNHPDGNCPLCLCPLVHEDDVGGMSSPFMKLMSCLHCFHVECIIRWWNWLQRESESSDGISSSTVRCPVGDVDNSNDLDRVMKESTGQCPVCRMGFHSKDLEHVLDLVGSHSTKTGSVVTKKDEDDEILQSDSENIRKQNFEAILKLQQENGGLIEPKKDIKVLPGMFLPQPHSQTTNKETTEPEAEESTVPTRVKSNGSSSRTGSTQHRNFGRRKPRVHQNQERKQSGHWVRKGGASSHT